MKIFLINPAFFDNSEFRNRFEDYTKWIKGGNLYVAPFEPPLGLAYLSAIAKKHGHDVTLLDMQGLMMDSEYGMLHSLCMPRFGTPRSIQTGTNCAERYNGA